MLVDSKSHHSSTGAPAHVGDACLEAVLRSYSSTHIRPMPVAERGHEHGALLVTLALSVQARARGLAQCVVFADRLQLGQAVHRAHHDVPPQDRGVAQIMKAEGGDRPDEARSACFVNEGRRAGGLCAGLCERCRRPASTGSFHREDQGVEYVIGPATHGSANFRPSGGAGNRRGRCARSGRVRVRTLITMIASGRGTWRSTCSVCSFAWGRCWRW